MSVTTEERIKHNIEQYWPFWNVGRHPYFQENRKYGTAKIIPWYHTEEMADRDELRSCIEASGRFVPAGHYAKLMIFQKSHRDESDCGYVWETVMSDTPDEMNDHEDVLINATGRVLIHGLGLGCVLHCLLHKPDVTSIDVVEVNADVIHLVHPFYRGVANSLGKTLNIHNASCVDKKWTPGTRWNYVWHDIWSTISPLNLRQDYEPEHGISYEKLHRMFQNRCDQQGSWGFRDSKWMRRVEAFEEDYIWRIETAWNFSDPKERMEILLDAVTPSGMETDQYVIFLKLSENTHGNAMFKRYEEVCQKEITPIEIRLMLGKKLTRYARTKIKSRR